MKSNLLLKVWGIVLTVAILSGLLMASVPVSAATSGYTAMTIPTSVYNGSNINVLKAAADGITMFAADATTNTLYKTTNAGASWSGSGATFGIGLPASAITSIAVSPNYVTDATLIVGCMNDLVYISTNGGTNFSDLGFVIGVGTQQISSVAITYGTSGLVVAVGTVDTTLGYVGKCWVFSGYQWKDQSVVAAPITAPTVITAGDVYSVAFSPSYAADAQIFAVVDTGANIVIDNRIITAGWHATYAVTTILTATRIVAGPLMRTSIAFGSDYTPYSSNFVVGLSGTIVAVAKDDVYVVNPIAATTTDLNVGGAATATSIYDVACTGPLASGVYVSYAGAATIRKATGIGSTVVWSAASVKSPTGTNALIIPTAAGLYVGTSGGAFVSAFQASSDDTVTFNGKSLYSVTTGATLVTKSLATVNSQTIFLMLSDGTGDILFKTIDGGANWLGVTSILNAVGFLGVYVSPSYATDSTVYVPERAPAIVVLKSTNGGSTFVPNAVGNPGTAMTAFVAVDGTTYYVGYLAALYKSNRFITSGAPTGTVTSIAVSPTAGELFLGVSGGNVVRSTDDGLTFSTLGALGGGAVTIVAVDPAYATNKTIYAGSTTVAGVYKWVVGTSATWTDITAGAAFINDISFGKNGELYASGTTGGMVRVISPATSAAVVDRIGATFVTGTITWLAATNVLTSDVYADGANNTLIMATDISSIYRPPATAYNIKLVSFTDVMLTAPVITTPAASVTLGAGSMITYTATPYNVGTTVAALAAKYDWQTAYDNTFAPASQVAAATTVATVGNVLRLPAATLSTGTTYYVRVRVSPTFPLVSPWSAPVSFTTKLTEAGTNLTTLGGMAPAAGGTVTIAAGSTTTSPVFQWAAVANATSYEIKISSKGDFSDVIDSSVGLTSTVYATPVKLAPGTYYWQVRAVNASTTGDWVQSAFTVAAPAVVSTATVAPVTIPQATIVIPTQPAPIVNVTVPTPTNGSNSSQTPAWAWVVIAIGAVLVIAVIVLIARTRRV